MPRKNLGKKLDVNGNLQDLGNTVSDEDLEKIDGIEEGSQKNVQADWNSTSGDSFIKNKPSVVTTGGTQTISGLKKFTNGIKLGEYGLQIKGDALDDPDFDSIVDPGFYFCKEILNGPIDFTGMATLEGTTGGALIVLPDRTQIVSYWGKIFARKFSIGQSVSTYAISGGGSTTTLPTVPAAGAYGEWVEIIDSDNEVFNFAQEEYNKSSNKFDINSLISSTSNACTSTISDGTINTIATGNYAYKLYYMSGLEIGKTYTLSFKGIKAGSSESQVFIGNEVNVDNTAYSRNWLGTTASTITTTFTATTNILSVVTYVSFGDYVNGASITLSDIMLNEGSEALPYQEWNGQIVHRGDIENSKLEKVWSGLVYAGGSSFTIPNYNIDNLYLVEFYSFSTYFTTLKILKNGSGQYIVQGDSSQFCRYRIDDDGESTFTINDASIGNTSNNAVVGVYKVKGGII